MLLSRLARRPALRVPIGPVRFVRKPLVWSLARPVQATARSTVVFSPTAWPIPSAARLFATAPIPPVRGDGVVRTVQDLMEGPGAVDIKQGRHVCNPDQLITSEEADRLNAMAKVLAKHADISIYIIRNYRNLPPGTTRELSDFTRALREAASSSNAQPVAQPAVVVAYFHMQRGIQINTDRDVHTLTDITDSLVPYFKRGHIADGLVYGLDRLGQVVSKMSASSPPPPPTASQEASSKPNEPSTDQPVKKTGRFRTWWRDFKGWNRAVLRGERSTTVTALYGAGVGATLYYMWQGIKFVSFWLAVAIVLWQLYKWVRRTMNASNADVQRALDGSKAPSKGAPVSPAPAPTAAPVVVAGAPAASANVAPKKSETEARSGADTAAATPPVKPKQAAASLFHETSDSGFWVGAQPQPGASVYRDTSPPIPESGFWKNQTGTVSTAPPAPEPKVPGVVKAAAVGAGAATVRHDFQAYREEQRRAEAAAVERRAAESRRASSSWASSDGGSSWGGSARSRGSSSGGSSWGGGGGGSSWGSSSSSSGGSSGGSSW